MSIWWLLLIVLGAGLTGGFINALISNDGIVLPRRTAGVLNPGFLGNVLIGGIAAAVSWSLYGPLASAAVASTGESASSPKGDLTLAAIGGAILVGIAGSRWLTNEVDKALLRKAGAEVAKRTSPQLADEFETSRPAQVVQAAQALVKMDNDSLAPGPEMRRQ